MILLSLYKQKNDTDCLHENAIIIQKLKDINESLEVKKRHHKITLIVSNNQEMQMKAKIYIYYVMLSRIQKNESLSTSNVGNRWNYGYSYTAVAGDVKWNSYFGKCSITI